MTSEPRLVYRPKALDDLDAIFDITGSDYPDRGLAFVQAIRDRCRRYLLETPMLGPARPDLGQGVRIYPIRGQRIVVAYRVEPDEIVVLRVFYGGADYAIMMAGDDTAE